MAHFDRNDFDIVVVIDDDAYKNPNWGKRLLDKANHNPVVSCIFEPGPERNKWLTYESNVYGFTGYAIHKNIIRKLGEALLQEWQAHQNACFLVDDELFTFFLRKQGIPISLYFNNINEVNARWLQCKTLLFR